jgi:serine/threonine protein kinase
VSRSIVGPLRRWDPERIGPYTIIGRLGAGAMGLVYLARSTAGRLVAVKTIRVELAEEPGFRARFAREVAAARQVSGVFTAAVVAADPEADRPWVATAYVPAPSLSVLVRECGPLPVPAVRWLAAGCAEALESIHAAGLLHRDVKPSNVLVAPDGPRVIDFGVARAAERVRLTVTRGAAGTPAYMAPEQARDAAQASPASDVFSLGATLAFAATGYPPYRGETVMDILVRLATEPPDLTGLPDELTGMIGACLERVPRDRPTTAAILAGLGSFAADTHIQDGPDAPGHGYLPDAAMALIAEYQRPPLRPGAAPAGALGDSPGEGGAGDDTAGSAVPAGTATSGSHTDLPGFDSAPDFGSLAGFAPPAASLPGSGSLDGSGVAEAPPSGPVTGTRLRRLLHLPGSKGSSRSRRRSAGAHPGDDVWPDNPGRVAVSSRPGTAAYSDDVWARGGAGPHPNGGGWPPGQHGGGARASRRPLAWAGVAVGALALIAAGTGLGLALRRSNNSASVPPPPCTSAAPDSTPVLCAPQTTGDSDTVFVLHGSGYVPGVTVTVSLAGIGSSPDRPVTDAQGTFNYAIDQGHYFFRGAIPPGTYTVVATARGEPTVQVSFSVRPPGSGPPPGQLPPAP